MKKENIIYSQNRELQSELQINPGHCKKLVGMDGLNGTRENITEMFSGALLLV